MSKSKTHGKDKKKSAQLVLRVEKSERDDFVALCERLDTTAAREIRRFMRDWVAAHAEPPAAPPAEPPAVGAEPVANPEPAPKPVAEVAPLAEAPKRRKKPAEAVVEAGVEPPATDLPAEAPKRRKKPAA